MMEKLIYPGVILFRKFSYPWSPKVVTGIDRSFGQYFSTLTLQNTSGTSVVFTVHRQLEAMLPTMADWKTFPCFDHFNISTVAFKSLDWDFQVLLGQVKEHSIIASFSEEIAFKSKDLNHIHSLPISVFAFFFPLPLSP